MGIVLIFDLDETLISTKKKYRKPYYFISEIKINERVFKIIKRAMQLREKGKVDAILLLTNNANVYSFYDNKEGRFLDMINLKFTEDFKASIDEIFDNVYTGAPGVRGLLNRNYNIVEYVPFGTKAKPSTWSGSPENPQNYRLKKDINTVKKMLSEIPDRHISLEKLEDRIFFFDDEPRPHALKAELDGHKGAYITITPPFGKGLDTTDLRPIETMLDALEQPSGGGTRKVSGKRKRYTLKARL
jgi:hypothetical protein